MCSRCWRGILIRVGCRSRGRRTCRGNGSQAGRRFALWPRLPGRVVSNLKLQTVRCREVRVLLCHLRACGCDPQERSASQRDYLECLFHPLLPLTLSLSSGHGFQPPVRAPKKRLQRLGKDLENDRTTLLVIKAMNECHLSRRHSLSQSISGNSRLKVRVSAALYNAPGPDTKRFQR